ncbi:MAG: response regulator, partial [Luteitalea sp.]
AQGRLARARSPRPSRERSLRILLAEENIVNQRVARGILGNAGHVVSVASNGLEALAAIERGIFDVLLLDLQMPVISGLEVLATLRGRERHVGGHLPIITLTAHALKGDREQFLAAGADGYVSKPISRDALFDELDYVLLAHTADHVETPRA